MTRTPATDLVSMLQDIAASATAPAGMGTSQMPIPRPMARDEPPKPIPATNSHFMGAGKFGHLEAATAPPLKSTHRRKCGAAWIAAAVLLVIALLAGAAIGAYFGISHKKSSSATGEARSFSASASNSPQPSSNVPTATPDAPSPTPPRSSASSRFSSAMSPDQSVPLDPALSTGNAAPLLSSAPSPSQSGTNSGKALVIGGNLVGTVTSTCLLLDPVTWIWSSTGALNIPRKNMAAVLMSDGKVLVSGGYSTFSLDSCLNATEVYDPHLETWLIVGSTAGCRIRGRMVALPDNHILLASGEDNATDAPRFSETYNPGTSLWTRNASMEQPHARGRMVAMQNGNAIIAGGQLSTWFLKTVEMFSCQAGRCSWHAVQELQVARSEFEMLCLEDGNIMVAGGLGGPECDYAGSIHLTGQPCQTVALASVELFDGVQWLFTGSLNDARMHFLMTPLPGGRVLVTGGWNGFAYVTSSEVYDMRTGVWQRVESLDVARDWTAMVTLRNGRAILAGGYDKYLAGNSGWLTSALVFNPVTESWAYSYAMPSGRSDMAMVAF